MSRSVVVLFGPPGAGKTTQAQASGLDVYDRDDDQWQSERQFKAALSRLGMDAAARAVVIRSGATISARQSTIALVKATNAYLLIATPAELRRRVSRRADRGHSALGIASWFSQFDGGDEIERFAGWTDRDVQTSSVGSTKPGREQVVEVTMPKPPPKYNPRQANGHRRRQVRARVLREETVCWLCGKPVDKTLKTPHPGSPEVDEIIPVSLGGSPIDRKNCHLSHRLCNVRRGNGTRAAIENIKRVRTY